MKTALLPTTPAGVPLAQPPVSAQGEQDQIGGKTEVKPDSPKQLEIGRAHV